MTSPPAPFPAVGSSAIAPLLTGEPRPVRVLAAFPAAAYLATDDGVLALVAADGVHHPNAVVLTTSTAALPLTTLAVAQRGRVGAWSVEVGEVHATISRWFDPVPRLRTTTPSLLAGKLAVARSQLLARTGSDGHDLAEQVRAVEDGLHRGDAAAVVAASRAVVGAGPGLTPSGDDVLAGLLAAVVTLGPAVASPAGGTLEATVARAGRDVVAHARDATTAVSAELLAHAVRGEVAEPAAAVLHAFTGRRSLAPALDSLLAVGATSGRDLAYGLVTGASLVVATAGAAATPVVGAPVTPTVPGQPAHDTSPAGAL